MNTLTTTQDYKKNIQVFRELAQIAVKSGNYPNMNEMTMINMMMSARDLGISPYKALNGGFYVVNGKISMSTSLMTDRIRKEGHSVKITEWTSKKCIIIGIRKDNQDSVKIEFTWEDAQAAGLTNSQTWKRYPKAMLYNRAMSMLARVLFPDVVGNCYSEDEGEEIGKNSFRSKTPPPIKEEKDFTPAEMKAEILKKITVEEEGCLEEYLAICQEKVNRPLRDLLIEWTENPKPFLDHYKKWLDKNYPLEIPLDEEAVVS